MKKPKKLPDVPSQLIRVALADLKKAEKSPKYKIDMGIWHEPMGGMGRCAVCFAGAVMAGSLGAKPDYHCGPLGFGEETAYKLEALDFLRNGEISPLLRACGEDFERRAEIKEEFYNTKLANVPQYENNPGQFKQRMAMIAGWLERRGL